MQATARTVLEHPNLHEPSPFAVSSDGSTFFTVLHAGAQAGEPRLVRCRLKAGPTALPAPGRLGTVSALALSPDGSSLVVATRTEGVWVLDASSGALRCHVPHKGNFFDWVGEVEVSPDGSRFLAAGRRQVAFFSMTGEPAGAVPRAALAGWAHARFVTDTRVLVGSEGGAALVEGETVTKLEAPHHQVSRVLVSADRATLVAAVYGALVVWGSDGAPRLVHRVRDVRGVGVSPDGAWVWCRRRGGSVVGVEVAQKRTAGSIRTPVPQRDDKVYGPSIEQRGEQVFVPHPEGVLVVSAAGLRERPASVRTAREALPGRWEDVVAAQGGDRLEPLTRWLAPWASCEETFELLQRCLARGTADANGDGSMTIEWSEANVQAEFAAPLEDEVDPPPALRNLLRQHNGVRIDGGAPDGFELSPCWGGELRSQCPEKTDPKLVAFADVEQDWALLDVQTGTVALLGHEGGGCEPTLDGPGDLLIRWLADRLDLA